MLPVSYTEQTSICASVLFQPSFADGHNQSKLDGWGPKGWYAAVPALALIVTAVGLLLGCTWCYRHKDCKVGAFTSCYVF